MKKIIVGLGNPGKKYAHTRHNIGFMIVDELARRISGEDATKFGSKLDAEVLDLGEYVFVKPQTFMNLSGTSVQKVSAFYKVSLDKICVIHDDADVPLGSYKFQTGKNAAGHKGVADVIEKLGSNSFWRARIGISRPYNAQFDIDDWVLERLSADEQSSIEKHIESIQKDIDNI